MCYPFFMVKKEISERKYLGPPLDPVHVVTFSKEEIARADARAKRLSPVLWALINAQVVTEDELEKLRENAR